MHVAHQAVLIKLSNGKFCVLERFQDKEGGLLIRDTSSLFEYSDWRAGKTRRCLPGITLRSCRQLANKEVPAYSFPLNNCYKVAALIVKFTTGITDD
jgi:hypothetical protein